MPSRVSIGKGTWGWDPGETRCKLLRVPLSGVTHGILHRPPQPQQPQCERWCLTGKTISDPVLRRLLGASHGGIFCLTCKFQVPRRGSSVERKLWCFSPVSWSETWGWWEASQVQGSGASQGSVLEAGLWRDSVRTCATNCVLHTRSQA